MRVYNSLMQGDMQNDLLNKAKLLIISDEGHGEHDIPQSLMIGMTRRLIDFL